MQAPRLWSGIDRQGRAWTCLHFPKAYGEALSAMPSYQRAKVLRGLVADMRRSVDG